MSASASGSPNGMYRQWAQYEDTCAWQKISFTLRTTTKFGVEDFFIRLDFAIRGEGAFIFDDVTVRELTDEETAPNFDFENDYNADDIPDGGYMSLARDMVGYREIDDTFYHDGKQSIHIVRESASEHGFVNSATLFPITAGYVYEFSFWYASCNASPEAFLRMDMYFYDANGARLQENGINKFVRGRQVILNADTERDEWSQAYTRTEIPVGKDMRKRRFSVRLFHSKTVFMKKSALRILDRSSFGRAQRDRAHCLQAPKSFPYCSRRCFGIP